MSEVITNIASALSVCECGKTLGFGSSSIHHCEKSNRVVYRCRCGAILSDGDDPMTHVIDCTESGVLVYVNGLGYLILHSVKEKSSLSVPFGLMALIAGLATGFLLNRLYSNR